MMRLASVESWPDLRVTFHLPPWTWRLKPYLWRDDVTPTTVFEWLFLTVEWQANRPVFREITKGQAVAALQGTPVHPDVARSFTDDCTCLYRNGVLDDHDPDCPAVVAES